MKSEFTKNTFFLILGTIAAQSIPLLLHPFLRRIYTPEDFGAMAIFLNLFAMLTIASSLRYESTIVLPKNNIESANILALTFVINLLFFSGILLLFFLFNEKIIELLGIPIKYALFIYLIPISGFFFGTFQSLNYWLIRQKAFKASSVNKLIRRLFEGGVQVWLGTSKNTGGLFIGDLIGNFSNFISGLIQVFRTNFSISMISPKKMKYVFLKYNDYPKYNLIPTLLSNVASMLPFLFINKFYSTETVGYLDLSRLVLSIPLIFISATISQVLFQQITEKTHHNKSIKKDLKNILYILVTIIGLEALFLFSAGNYLFKIIFGDQYIVSAEYSKILIVSFSLNFITSTFSSLFISLNKIKINSIWQIFYFLCCCSLFFLKDLEISLFIKSYVLLESIALLVNILLIIFISKEYEDRIN